MKEFELFLKEKRFVENVAENTIVFYKQSFRAFIKGGIDFENLSKLHLVEVIGNLRESGMSANCVDAYIRGFNPFLTWLFENEVTPVHYKIKRQKLDKRVMKPFTDSQMKAIINYKPKDYYQKRLHCLLLLLMDTGIRINEALTLEKQGVDFDNLLISVIGKGSKERIIPFSIEMRKTLYKFSGLHKFDLIFCNKNGGKLGYNNLRRAFNQLVKKLGIEGVDGTFHAFRRSFATNYIRENGNPLKLQRMLGHTTLKQTNEYVKLINEDLSKEHQRTSILNKHR